MPAGWFTQPVRDWPALNFTSALCTAGHPLCMLSAKAISEDRRAEQARVVAARGAL